MAATEDPQLETRCIVITDGDHEVAARLGCPREGLETSDIETTAAYAKSYEDPVSDEMLLKSFVHYWGWDGWMPPPGSPPPLPAAEHQRMLDQAFLDLLGPELAGTSCRSPGCECGAVEHSVLCATHHFEMIWRRPPP